MRDKQRKVTYAAYTGKREEARRRERDKETEFMGVKMKNLQARDSYF